MVLSVSDDLSSTLIGGFLLGGGEEGGDREGDGESNDELGEGGRVDGASADSTRLSSLTADMTTVYIIIYLYECDCMHNACEAHGSVRAVKRDSPIIRAGWLIDTFWPSQLWAT